MLLEYMRLHTSNAYDLIILRMYAQCLSAAGYRDQAAGLYYKLIQVRLGQR